MKLQSGIINRVSLALLIVLLTSISAVSQAQSELRKKYGEPELIEGNNEQSKVERYKARPGVALTVTYSKKGAMSLIDIRPIENTVSPMPTEVVIDLINELVPASTRGKKIGEGHINGGDPAMKLNHNGCRGVDFVFYEHVGITCTTWCDGGTFSARIVLGEREQSEQRLKARDRRKKENAIGPI